jgi:hypothetical protein
MVMEIIPDAAKGYERRSSHRHGRARFLMPGVEAVLRAAKPEAAAEQGDTPSAQLRRRRRDLHIAGLTRPGSSGSIRSL